MKWWQQSALTWREIAASVPDISELPDVELPGDIKHTVYQPDAPPVFFGHYWLNGVPPNVAGLQCALSGLQRRQGTVLGSLTAMKVQVHQLNYGT